MRTLMLCFICLVIPTVGLANEPALAVLRFDNHTRDPELEPLGRALADMLITDLATLSGIKLLERLRMQDLLAEVDLNQSAYVDPNHAVKIGKLVGATHVLVGAVVEASPKLRIDARIVSVGKGEVQGTASVAGDKADFFLLEKELATAVAQRLELPLSRREEMRLASRVATESLEATLAWARGLDALDRGEIEAAKKEFEASLAADGDFEPAKLAMRELAERIERLVVEQSQAAAAESAGLLKDLAALREAGDMKGLVQRVGQLARLSGTLPLRDQMAQHAAILAAEIPDSVGLGGVGSRPSITEWSLLQQISIKKRLGHAADALALAEAFTDRYGDSNMLRVVQSTVEAIERDLLQRQTDLQKKPELEEQAQDEVAHYACMGIVEPQARRDACFAYAKDRLSTGKRIAVMWYDIMYSLVWVGDRKGGQEVVEAVRQVDPDSATSVEYAFTYVFGPHPHEEERSKRELARKGVQSMLDYTFDLPMSVRQRYLKKFRRTHPNIESVWTRSMHFYLSYNAREEARQTLEQIRKRFGDADVTKRAEEYLTDLDARIYRYEHQEAYRLLDLAENLDRYRLYPEAAEAWGQLAKVDPTFAEHSAADSLYQQGYALEQGRGPDWDLAVQEVYGELIRQFPQHEKAKAAQKRLKSLRP